MLYHWYTGCPISFNRDAILVHTWCFGLPCKRNSLFLTQCNKWNTILHLFIYLIVNSPFTCYNGKVYKKINYTYFRGSRVLSPTYATAAKCITASKAFWVNIWWTCISVIGISECRITIKTKKAVASEQLQFTAFASPKSAYINWSLPGSGNNSCRIFTAPIFPRERLSCQIGKSFFLMKCHSHISMLISRSSEVTSREKSHWKMSVKGPIHNYRRRNYHYCHPVIFF